MRASRKLFTVWPRFLQHGYCPEIFHVSKNFRICANSILFLQWVTQRAAEGDILLWAIAGKLLVDDGTNWKRTGNYPLLAQRHGCSGQNNMKGHSSSSTMRRLSV